MEVHSKQCWVVSTQIWVKYGQMCFFCEPCFGKTHTTSQSGNYAVNHCEKPVEDECLDVRSERRKPVSDTGIIIIKNKTLN